jgi:hypothetical protein
MTTAMPDPQSWTPPEPREFPDWRNHVMQHMATKTALHGLADAIDSGKFTILPVMPGYAGAAYSPQTGTTTASRGAVAAPVLAATEVDRLASASLFYASADMTSLAVAAAQTPPTEPFSERRLPADTGFMLFAEPIGGYTIRVNQAVPEWHSAPGNLMLTTPIVAVSWSRWNPSMFTAEHDHAVRWYFNQGGRLRRIPSDFDGVWLTFYSESSSKWGHIDEDEPVARLLNGKIVTAGDVHESMRRQSSPPLTWDNEMAVKWDADISKPPRPDTIDQWLHVVYTAWQLLSQISGSTRPLTESEEVHRPKHIHKRDVRAGVSGPPGVKVIRLHAAYRPSTQAADADAARSSGRRQFNWSCRWPVKPHRRYVCLNPRQHKDSGCQHEDRIIPFHIKGPADKPFRAPSTVRLWDSFPD